MYDAFIASDMSAWECEYSDSCEVVYQILLRLCSTSFKVRPLVWHKMQLDVERAVGKIKCPEFLGTGSV